MDTCPQSRSPASEELLRLLVESAHDYAIFSMDSAGLVTSWNSGATRLMGWTADEIMGSTADVIFTSEDRAASVPDLERSQALLTGRAEDERWQERKDGTRFWASGLMMSLNDPAEGFVKILRDRTEKHLADEQLRASEERFRLLATHIPQLVFRCRSDGSRTWPSPQWIEFTGVGFAESLEMGWLDGLHPDDREGARAGWRTAEHTGEYYHEHRVRRQSDGQYRWHQTRAKPILAGHGAGTDWVGTMTDVHDLRGLQERQKVLVAELQHRTRNLLAMAQSIATQTLRRSPSLETFEKEFDQRMRALGRVQSLVTGTDYQNVNLRDLIVAELQAYDLMSTKSDRVSIEGPATLLPPRAAQTLGLSLHELTTNAVKYGALSKPGGRLSVNWRIEAYAGGRRVLLKWKESGIALGSRPARTGFGRELIERALPYQLGAETRLLFEPDGVHCTIGVPLKEERDG
jgi:PAS domain S-box-containing protein